MADSAFCSSNISLIISALAPNFYIKPLPFPRCRVLETEPVGDFQTSKQSLFSPMNITEILTGKKLVTVCRLMNSVLRETTHQAVLS